MCSRGVSHARDLYQGPRLLWTCRALQAFYQGICSYCVTTPFPKQDVLLRKYLGDNANMEEGCTLFHMHNSLFMSTGLLYVSTMPNGEAEGVLAFLVPTDQCHVALNGVHCNTGHQHQQRMLALTQERFWWPMMAEDCQALVQGCQQYHVFEGAITKVPLCSIRAHVPLEIILIDFTSVESTMELNKLHSIKNVLVITDHFTRYTLAFIMRDQTAKTMAKVLFIAVFGVPTKLLSDCGANFTSCWSRNSALHLASRNAEPLPIMRSVMGRWSNSIKPYPG